MKTSFLKVAVIAFSLQLTSISFAQINQAGIQMKYNFARHLVVQKNTPKKFARTAQNILASPGIDLFMDYSMNDQWSVRTKLGLETKGFVGNFTPYIIDQSAYKYHHASLDLSVLRYYGQGALRFYNYLGITSGYQFTSQVPPLEGVYQHNSTITEEYQKFYDYQKVGLGGVLGIGMNVNNFMWLELEYNRDVLASIETETAREYNLVYSVQVGFNVLKMITSDK
jgi:hypothetical protein